MLITALAATAVAAPPAGVLTHRAAVRARNARRLRITSPAGIDRQYFARIGGIEQWLSIRGENRANPVVVELHGGPGSSNSVLETATRPWEEHVTLVRWDMRGTGKTLRRSGAPDGLTLQQLVSDAVEVVEHVRAGLGAERVVLLGCSFGSAVALRVARSRPDLVSACVGADQKVFDPGQDAADHRALLDRLERAGKKKDAAAVRAMGPDPRTWSAEQFSAYHRAASATDPHTFAAMKSLVMKGLWFSPRHTLREIPLFFRGFLASAPLLPDTAGLDDRAEGTRLDVPFFVVQGACDLVNTPARARAFFDAVEAPVKEFTEIPDAGHFAVYRRPELFLDLLRTRILPAASLRPVR